MQISMNSRSAWTTQWVPGKPDPLLPTPQKGFWVIWVSRGAHGDQKHPLPWGWSTSLKWAAWHVLVTELVASAGAAWALATKLVLQPPVFFSVCLELNLDLSFPSLSCRKLLWGENKRSWRRSRWKWSRSKWKPCEVIPEVCVHRRREEHKSVSP